MAARRSFPGLITALLLSSACNPKDTGLEDTGFHVALVKPADKDMEVVDAVSPEIGFNDIANSQTCTTETILLVGSNQAHAVTYTFPYTLSHEDSGRRIVIDPVDPLLRGYWYSITIRSGVEGCTDDSGRMVLPFASSFYVAP